MRLHLPNIDQLQTPELVTLQQEKDKLHQNMLYFKSQMEHYRDQVDDLEMKISSVKLEKTSISTQFVHHPTEGT